MAGDRPLAATPDGSAAGDAATPDLVRLSKAVSRILRHRPDAAGVVLDRRGWCRIDALLEGLARNGTPLTRAQLETLVHTSDKARFALSDDNQLIRASHGHSIAGVQLDLPPKAPPQRLYHGTVAAALAAIEREGLRPMRRQYVHLLPDSAAARAAGARRGAPIVLAVDAGQMQIDGHRFWLSDNGVWLTDAVPPLYLTRLS